MHDNFADWYRIVSIDPQQINLDKRWRGIEAYSKNVDKPAMLDVVRQLFDYPINSPDSEASFRRAFKKADNSFQMRGNSLEIQVLAGATIAHLLTSDNTNLADTVALAVVCSDFQGIREKILLNEIIDISQVYLFKRSNNLRLNLLPPSITPLTTQPPVVPNNENPVETSAEVAALVQPALKVLNGLPNNLVQPINDALLTLSKQLFLQQEESNMLWWLFAACSRDLKIKISQLSLPATSLVIGKELADLTFVLPGPVAVEAFLDKMLESSARNTDNENITVQQAISADSLQAWKIELLKVRELDSLTNFCSLHYAIKQSTETENETEWLTQFAKQSGVPSDRELPAVTLALQMYRESLLIKAMQ